MNVFRGELDEAFTMQDRLRIGKKAIDAYHKEIKFFFCSYSTDFVKRGQDWFVDLYDSEDDRLIASYYISEDQDLMLCWVCDKVGCSGWKLCDESEWRVQDEDKPPVKKLAKKAAPEAVTEETEGRVVGAFTGLWERWKGDETIESCTLLTTTPNELVASVGHNRMPVMLTTEAEYAEWLNPETVERGRLEHLFAPFDPAAMLHYPAKT